MALEKLHGTQLVSWRPPLPQRAFRLISAGITSDNTGVAGLDAHDGRRFGYYVLDTSQWAVAEGTHQPPVQAGEKFQLWTSNVANQNFYYPSMFGARGGISAAPNSSVNVNAPDLFNVYTLTENREAGGGNPVYAIKDSTVRTVAAVSQAGTTSWYVYFSPAPNNVIGNAPFDGIVTIPQPFRPRYLGQLGHVSGISYTYALPGGPEQLQALLHIEARARTEALDPGRIITAHRGGACIWEGQLTEPQPSSIGWTITANGCGTYGANFGAWWQAGAGPTAKSSGWFPDGPIDFALARGLRWINRGIGKPAGIYTGPVQNPGSMTITDFMNLLCTGGSLVWELVQPATASAFPPGPWELAVYPLPTDSAGNPLLTHPSSKVQVGVINGGKWKRTDLITSKARRPPDLHLVATAPAPRTIKADYNTIILYYQATPDITATSTKPAVAATYATTFVDAPGSVAAHGRMEYYLDISNAGPMSSAQAQQIGLNVLTKYIRANFASSFAVQPGQLTNPGGQPVDLGCNWCGAVVQVQGASVAQGGEIGLSPLTFVIGQYAFDDDTQTATVTPYQNALTDIASVIASLYPGKFA